MRYIRKKRLGQWLVGCFLIVYMCFILLHATQYNISQDEISSTQGSDQDHSIIEDDDIPIIREQKDGYSNDARKMKNIAIVFALTSKGTFGRKTETIDIHEHHLIKIFLPTFCNTATHGYAYSFYFSIDKRDDAFESLPSIFNESLSQQCTKRNISVVTVKLVHCDHNDKPAWAQNDGMMEAYIDGMDYGYRLNDDIKLATPGWTEIFIDVLLRSNPPNVGVVGPGQNTTLQYTRDDILTFDFTSSVHIDIFGFHYPKAFIDWCGDDWISKVYQQPNRVWIEKDVDVIHYGMPYRYKPHKKPCGLLEDQVKQDKVILNAYLDNLQLKTQKVSNKYAKVSSLKKRSYGIGLSLWKNDRDFIYGTLRNIQLANIFFPNWFVRVFIPINIPYEAELLIGENVIRKMKSLGADVVYVNLINVKIPSSLISTLIADDEDVTHFIIRDVRHRLSKCDADEVNEFINSDKSIHFKGAQMWAGNRQKILTHLGGKNMKKFLQETVRGDSLRLKNLVSQFQEYEFIKAILEKTEGDSYNNTKVKCPNDGKMFDYYGEIVINNP